MIIDGKLIDIKTTVKLEFNRDHYNQLIGYYILSRIGNIIGLPEGEKITELGIYYSRYGILKTISTRIIDEHPEFDRFIRWFSEAASAAFPIEM